MYLLEQVHAIRSNGTCIMVCMLTKVNENHCYINHNKRYVYLVYACIIPLPMHVNRNPKEPYYLIHVSTLYLMLKKLSLTSPDLRKNETMFLQPQYPPRPRTLGFWLHLLVLQCLGPRIHGSYQLTKNLEFNAQKFEFIILSCSDGGNGHVLSRRLERCVGKLLDACPPRSVY